MPRTPRKSPRKPGRPAKTAQVGEALARVERTGESIAEAARARGINPDTVHAHKRRAGKGAAAARPGSPPPSPPPDPSSPPAGSHGAAPAPSLPQGGAVSGRPDLLELVRRILEARNAPARTELDEGLAVHVAGGEPALAAWLARPIAAVEIGRDELLILQEGLGVALGVARTADAGGPQLRALGIVERLAKSVSVVSMRRPAEAKPNEVQEAIRAEMNTCVGFLVRSTREAAAKFARDRQELAAWAGQELAPRVAAELDRRVDAMLGGAPS